MKVEIARQNIGRAIVALHGSWLDRAEAQALLKEIKLLEDSVKSRVRDERKND